MGNQSCVKNRWKCIKQHETKYHGKRRKKSRFYKGNEMKKTSQNTDKIL